MASEFLPRRDTDRCTCLNFGQILLRHTSCAASRVSSPQRTKSEGRYLHRSLQFADSFPVFMLVFLSLLQRGGLVKSSLNCCYFRVIFITAALQLWPLFALLTLGNFTQKIVWCRSVLKLLGQPDRQIRADLSSRTRQPSSTHIEAPWWMHHHWHLIAQLSSPIGCAQIGPDRSRSAPFNNWTQFETHVTHPSAYLKEVRTRSVTLL